MFILENQNDNIDSEDITKYHENFSNFNRNLVDGTINFICKKLFCTYYGSHFLQQCKERMIPIRDILTIVNMGECFEYKLIDKKYLFRMAFRMKTRGHGDDIYVLQPFYNTDYQNVSVKYITAYNNRHLDNHYTLDKTQYELGKTYYDYDEI